MTIPSDVPRNGTRFRDIGPLGIASAGIALILRIIHVWSTKDVPTVNHLIGDAAGYYQWSQRIAAGEWLGNAGFYQAPLYPYLLAAWHWVGADSVQAVRVLQCLWGAAAAGLLVVAGSAWFGRGAGVLAGLMLACYGPAIYFDGILQKASLDNLLVCALLACVCYTAGSLFMGLILGAVVSLLCLTRENALVWHLVLPVWLLFGTGCGTPKKSRNHAKLVAAYLLGAGLVLLPVAVRNSAVQGEFALTTFQAGPNFYIGNHQGADGRYQPLVRGHESPVFEQRDATRLAEQASGRKLSPREVSRYWMRQAWNDIASDPLSWCRLMGYKLALTWNRYEIADAESIVLYRRFSPVLGATGTVWHFGTLAPLAVLGLALTWQQRKQLWVLYGLMITITLAVAAFYVLARYRYPLVPFLILFASGGFIELVRRPYHFRRLLLPMILAVAAAFVVNWSIQDERRLDAMAEMNAGVALAQAGDVQEAGRYFARAVAGHPTSVEANYNLAMSLALQGKYSDAIPAYQQALTGEPNLPGLHYNLAVALEQTGNVAEAKRHYELAIQKDPGDLEAKAGLRRIESR